MPTQPFHFKKFRVEQEGAAHRVGTDAVLLGAWAEVRDCNRFLDIGTGTGVIALMIAQRLDEWREKRVGEQSEWNGVGVEIHPESAALATANFAASPWAERLQAHCSSVQDFQAGQSFDLIVSNPPFFSELTVSPNPTRSIGRHTATLSPGALLESVARLLAPKGRFCTILPEQEGRRLCEHAVLHGLYWTKITALHSRPGRTVERLLLQFERNPYPFERASLCLYAHQNGPLHSAAFLELTGAFLL